MDDLGGFFSLSCEGQGGDREIDTGLLLGAHKKTSLLNATWRISYQLSTASAAEQHAWLGALLDAALVAPEPERFLALEDLIHHLELFAPSRRAELVAAHVSARHEQTNSSSALPEDSVPRRLKRRLKEARWASNQIEPGEPPIHLRAAGQGNKAVVVIIVPDYLSAGSFLQPPIGALLAASRLRQDGFACRVIDNRVDKLSFERLAEEVADAACIAIVTTPYDHIQNYFLDYRLRHALATVASLKQAAPDTPLAICGAHGTVRPDIVFRDAPVDYIVRGEFDSALLSLVQALRNGERPPPEILKRGDPIGPVGTHGGVVPFQLVDLNTQFRTRVFDAPGLRPAYDLVNLEAYFGDAYQGVNPTKQKRWATILASRGCAHNCTYCYNYWGRHTRRREPADVVDEMAWLERDLGIEGVFFIDFNFTENRRWIADFCAEIRRKGVRLAWTAQTRCDAVDDDMFAMLAAAHCHGLWFGVESFDQDVSASMTKYKNFSAIDQAIAGCISAGIKPHLFIMIGAPGETRDSLNETIRHIHRHKAAYCGVMPTTPRFGTALYAEAKQQFPSLGNDFYSLRGVRGLVGNALMPSDLQNALLILNDRQFVEATEAPRLPSEHDAQVTDALGAH